jgi:2'-5' RNA ligase
MMKYFIGYLIRGEAAEWHAKLAKEISEKFGLWKIHENIPPHVTIFYPEGVEDISEIKDYIKNWTENNKASGNFYLNGFDHFYDKVVFGNIEADDIVTKSVESLREGIRNLAHIENESFPDWHPHSTLMNRVGSEEINEVWEYVNALEKPNFTLPFDNVAIFKFVVDRKWEVDSMLDFGGKE